MVADELRETLRRLDNAQPTPIGDRILVEGEMLRSLAAELDALRQLVIEAYPSDHPTNGWRRRAEKLNAWPGAVHAS